MDKNDYQWKILTGIASGVMGLYLGMDILYKRLKGNVECIELEKEEEQNSEESTDMLSPNSKNHVYNQNIFNIKTNIS
jgi:hypothetical protein